MHVVRQKTSHVWLCLDRKQSLHVEIPDFTRMAGSNHLKDYACGVQVAVFGSDPPIGRPGQPKEYGPVAVFLASETDSSYVVGAIVGVAQGSEALQHWCRHFILKGHVKVLVLQLLLLLHHSLNAMTSSHPVWHTK